MNELLRVLHRIVEDDICSDVHFEEGCVPKIRGPEAWIQAEADVVDRAAMAELLDQVDQNWKAAFKQGKPVSATLNLASIGMRDERFRCFGYTVDAGRRIAASIRPISRMPMKLEELGLPPVALTYANAPKGLLLVTGPTGSGKTTTIMAMLSKILANRACHIVTIEDPIEYVLDAGTHGIVSQREVGFDTESYSTGLKEALRQRPEAIMVGEIRDEETAVTALRAAESGHFVVATMHARSALGALQKLRALAGADAGAVAYAMAGVLAQVLVPTADGTRVLLAAELLYCLDKDLQAHLVQEKWGVVEEILRRAEKGSVSLNKSLSDLVARQLIQKEAAWAAAYDGQAIRQLIKG